LDPASIGFTFIQKFANDHLDIVDRTSGYLFLRNVNDFGVVADGTLDLYCFGFISHTPSPESMQYTIGYFSVSMKEGQ
jgi:hypothetical protein